LAREKPSVVERARSEADQILRGIGGGKRSVIKAVDLSKTEMDLIMNAESAKGSEQYDHEVTDTEQVSKTRQA